MTLTAGGPQPAASPTLPVRTPVSSNATRDAARTMVAPPALASGAAGEGHPHAGGRREGLQKNEPQRSTWGWAGRQHEQVPAS